MSAAGVENLPALTPVHVRLTAEGVLEREGWPSQRLTRIEARLILAIARRHRCVDKGALYTELYGTRSEADMPEPKIVDVMVCKLRHKLDALGAKDAVTTVWGRGYALNRPAFEVDLVDEDHLMVPTDAQLNERLERLAIASGSTTSALARDSLRIGLEALERKAWGNSAA